MSSRTPYKDGYRDGCQGTKAQLPHYEHDKAEYLRGYQTAMQDLEVQRVQYEKEDEAEAFRCDLEWLRQQRLEWEASQ